MEITYDREADAVYIEFQEGDFATNRKIDDFTIIDLDASGNILGIELLAVSKRLPRKALAEVHVKNMAVVR